MLWSTLQYLLMLTLHYFMGIVYPLFRSSRITRGKECEENKIRILKYWVIFSFIHIIQYYFDGVLSAYFEIGNLSIACLETILVILDFKYAELLYDNIIF